MAVFNCLCVCVCVYGEHDSKNYYCISILVLTLCGVALFEYRMGFDLFEIFPCAGEPTPCLAVALKLCPGCCWSFFSLFFFFAYLFAPQLSSFLSTFSRSFVNVLMSLHAWQNPYSPVWTLYLRQRDDGRTTATRAHRWRYRDDIAMEWMIHCCDVSRAFIIRANKKLFFSQATNSLTVRQCEPARASTTRTMPFCARSSRHNIAPTPHHRTRHPFCIWPFPWYAQFISFGSASSIVFVCALHSERGEQLLRTLSVGTDLYTENNGSN